MIANAKFCFLLVISTELSLLGCTIMKMPADKQQQPRLVRRDMAFTTQSTRLEGMLSGKFQKMQYSVSEC